MNDYKHLTICNVNIPKSGKKLLSLSGVELFIRSLGGLVYIYECSTKRLLVCCDVEKRNTALALITTRLQEVKEMVSCINSSGHSEMAQ